MAKRRRASQGCPCTSGLPYAKCCGPFHRGAEPATAVALMRSRFAAFALGDGAYLWRTLSPRHALRARPEADVVVELSRMRQRLRYQRLTVHEHVEDGDRARVLFTAYVFERGRDRSFAELSDFERHAGAWRYLDGLTGPPGEVTIAAFLEALERPRGRGEAARVD